MTRNVVTVHGNMSIAAALRLMLEKRIRRLPVIEGGEGTERLVGIATLSDVRAGYPAHIDPRSPVAQDAVDSSVTVERIMSRSALTTTAGVAVEQDAEKHARLLTIAARTCYLHATAAASLPPAITIVHNDRPVN